MLKRTYLFKPEDPIRDVFRQILGKEPPDFVRGYTTTGLSDDENQTLQEWVLDCLDDSKMNWSTGVGVIDAAELIVQEAIGNGNIEEPKMNQNEIDLIKGRVTEENLYDAESAGFDFCDGRNAHRNGNLRDANPHSPSSGAHLHWNRGWDSRQKEIHLLREKDLFNDALEKAASLWLDVICMQNPSRSFMEPGRTGVVLIAEYKKGIYKIRLGNIFSGIPANGPVETFNSLDELLSVWVVD